MLLFGKRAKILAAFVLVVVCLLLPSKPAQAGSGIQGYLWSATVGWISMSCSNGGTCATADYGVKFGAIETFGDKQKAKIRGFAWSSSMGWICFGETCDGVTDKYGQFLKNPENTDSNYAEWVRGEAEDGRLYGWARLVNEGAAGWISLNCDNRVSKVCTESHYYVSLDSSEGTFCDEGE